MALKMFASPTSPFSARLRLVAAFTGTQLEETSLAGAPGSEERRQVTYFGKIPGLEVDGRVLIESCPLMEFLVEDAGGSSLMPSDPVARARVRGIMAAHDNWVLGAAWPMFMSFKTGKPDPNIIKPSLRDAAAQYLVLTRLFDQDSDLALFGVPTLADLAIAPFALLFAIFYPRFGEAYPFESDPRLARWWAAVRAVPEVGETLAPMDAAFTRAFAAR